jgi:hypothetical protein
MSQAPAQIAESLLCIEADMLEVTLTKQLIEDKRLDSHETCSQ